MDPPFEEKYKSLFNNDTLISKDEDYIIMSDYEEHELPTIDLHRLTLSFSEGEQCVKEIRQAAREWGFFQVVNHGIPQEILERIQLEQRKLFHHPFSKKAEENVLNLPGYTWSNPTATCLRQLPWLEVFHIPLTDLSKISGEYRILRESIEAYTATAEKLAKHLSEILAENLGVSSTFFQENCLPETSYLRMNRYPPCPFSSEVLGALPHTDSCFVNVLNQDQIGGLQLWMNGKWISVKPNPKALIINIGDLFQVVSNDVYKSIRHRVLASKQAERFSLAYLYCPRKDSVIESGMKPSMYRKFSFGELMEQNARDVKETGNKGGIPRFLV
ncbi:PREDICTED: gibberellin 2-beta-dioxygenase 8-like [Populus euphratica]|uniref:Gibberellin 2-beta-dioxygenase 8-like n=1 Tax=Populus euphratica TaxID=75702 RepID=A0AAJ6UK16_POPEU|nr:PREDICTED: gibberellin 2-beta-dioxygenase 8-like [Populus euphratica]